MELNALYEAIDARPFRPFTIEIISGRQVTVSHPDNILVLPNRQSVRMIQVFHTDPWEWALIWPDGIAGLFQAAPGSGNGGDRPGA